MEGTSHNVTGIKVQDKFHGPKLEPNKVGIVAKHRSKLQLKLLSVFISVSDFKKAKSQEKC